VAAPEVLVAAEDVSLFAAAYPDVAMPRADSGAAESIAHEPDKARQETVRRALATSGPTTTTELAQRLVTPQSAIAAALAVLEAEGAVFHGHFTTSAREEDASTEQWCDRYVLERIHRQTLSQLRSEVEPCSDPQFAAFRFRWQHLGAARLEPGAESVRVVLEQLSGLAFTPAFWEQGIFPSRIRDYRPEHLDLLCMSGEFAWIAEPLEDDPGHPIEFPSRVAFMPRRGAMARDARTPASDARDDQIIIALRDHGAQYLDQLSDYAGVSERDALAALWRLAAAGLVSNDSFAPLRMLAAEPDAIRALPGNGVSRSGAKHDAAVRARLKSSLSGRWSAVGGHDQDSAVRPKHEAASPDRVRVVAQVLLARHGILSREMLALEPFEITWQTLSFALRRMEYAGLIRRGWFVRALSGEQYALPQALQMLTAIRSARDNDDFATIAATDPANPYGVLLPGCGVTREPANVIIAHAGRVVLGLAGRALVMPERLADDRFVTALAALMRVRPKVAIDTIEGVAALESEYVGPLAALRFHSDGRALIYDGLPGPMPARAAASLRIEHGAK
jgi:ATP-dependent Lhr-like helicase